MELSSRILRQLIKDPLYAPRKARELNRRNKDLPPAESRLTAWVNELRSRKRAAPEKIGPSEATKLSPERGSDLRDLKGVRARTCICFPPKLLWTNLTDLFRIQSQRPPHSQLGKTEEYYQSLTSNSDGFAFKITSTPLDMSFLTARPHRNRETLQTFSKLWKR